MKPDSDKPPQDIQDTIWYPVVFMFMITLVLSSILIGVNSHTRSRVEKNRELMFERAVMASVLPDQFTMESPADKVHTAFQKNIQSPDSESDPAYRYYENGNLTAYALPFSGKGFWDRIKGVIGFRPDRQTITGIAFVEQNETPGLGGEIVKPYFRERFEGITIRTTGKAVNLVAVSEETGANRIHAITGATQTSNKLEIIINNAVKNWKTRGEKP